jgi:hypothetical protein
MEILWTELMSCCKECCRTTGESFFWGVMKQKSLGSGVRGLDQEARQMDEQVAGNWRIRRATRPRGVSESNGFGGGKSGFEGFFVLGRNVCGSLGSGLEI